MEQQEMLTAWKELQTRVETLSARQAATQSQFNESLMKSKINRTKWSPVGDLAMASIATVVIGSFVADNIKALLEAPITALPAIILFVCSILLINVSVRQLILASGLDYSKSIVETQVQLAKLRKLRVRSTQWTFICALPFWVLFPILLGQILISPKIMMALNPAWVVGNIIVGLVLALGVNWILKKSRFALTLDRAIAGKDILEAQAFLKDIGEFKAA